MNFHTKGLLAHFSAMQSKVTDYLMPGTYTSFVTLEATTGGDDEEAQKRLFVGDMIYMLDGPQQRQAQTAASFDYQALALRTCPPGSQFHGDMVSMAELRKTLAEFIAAADKLDKIKKALFYRKGDPIGITVTANAELANNAAYILAGLNPKDVESVASDQTAQADFYDAVQIIHAVIGLATESGEAVEAIYKSIFGGVPLDRVNLMEEFGDAKWYIAIGLDPLGYEWGEDEIANIDKLRLRFPDKFDNQLAINRDHDAERVILENRVATQFEGMTRDDLGLPLEGTVSTPRHHIGAPVGKSAPDGSHDTKEPHGE